MGQYYLPMLFDAEGQNCTKKSLLATFYSHDFGNGLKLMEHSWVGNALVCAVLCKIKEFGAVRLLWGGDYADDELVRMCIKIKESKYERAKDRADRALTVDDFKDVIDGVKEDFSARLDKDIFKPWMVDVLVGHEIKEMLGMHLKDLRNCSSEIAYPLYRVCREDKLVKIVRNPRANPRYILNHTKMQYVDIKHVTAEKGWDTDDWFIHPLPLLTCEGCGRGGGDYHRDMRHPSYKYVGLWARDIISVTQDDSELAGFEEIRPDFHEND